MIVELARFDEFVIETMINLSVYELLWFCIFVKSLESTEFTE